MAPRTTRSSEHEHDSGARADRRSSRRGWREPLTRAVVVLAAFAVLVVVTFGWQVRDSQRGLRAQVLTSNLNTAEAAAAALSTQLKAHVVVVDQAVRIPDVVKVVRSGNPELARVVLNAVRNGGQFGPTYLLDTSGRIVAADSNAPAPAGSDLSASGLAERGAAIDGAFVSSALHLPNTPGLVVGVAGSLRDPEGHPYGILLATLPSDNLNKLAGGLSLPAGGSLEIFDGTGRWLNAAAAGATTYASSPAVADALLGHAGVGEYLVPGRVGKRLAAYSNVSGAGWAVVVEQDRGAAYRPVVRLTTRLGIIAGLLALVAGAGVIVLFRMLRELDSGRSRYAAVLASIADGAVITDADGIIQSLNRSMEALTGWSGADAVGRPFGDVFLFFDSRGRAVDPNTQPLAKAIASRSTVVTRGFDLSLAACDGRRIPVGVTGAPVLQEDGTLLGGVAIVRDVSYEREADQLKSSLVSTVSHELRTPLTMIHGFSELLLEREVSPDEAREALEHIHVSAGRLGRLIDDLLSVSRIESGRMGTKLEAVPLADVAREVAATFEIHRTVELALDQSCVALADRDMVVQILTNLVSNAAKYSDPSTPVRIEVRPGASGPYLTVVDRGIGLSEDECCRLFEKFFRVDRREVREAGGTGLGLYITRNLVEIQGGQIWVESNEGEGSRFTVALPSASRQLTGASA